jgi:putative ABC transport system permease protein
MGIPLAEGRYLDESDRRQPRIVISAEAARRLWPGEGAVGKKVTWDADEDEPYEVVGVVSDVKTGGLRESPVPIGYISYWNLPADAASYSVRTTQDPASFGRVVQDTVWSIDPTLPVANLRTMDEISSSASAEHRFQASLAILLSAVALTLAALGIYGVVSYATARRTKEIGLRMALGAESSQIASMVLAQGMRPILFGLVAGLVAVALTASRIEALLFEVSAHDPASYAIAAAVLLTAAALACYFPVRRATRINPLAALRYE